MAPQTQQTDGHLGELAAIVAKLSGKPRRHVPRFPRKSAVVVLALLAMVSVLNLHTQRRCGGRERSGSTRWRQPSPIRGRRVIVKIPRCEASPLT